RLRYASLREAAGLSDPDQAVNRRSDGWQTIEDVFEDLAGLEGQDAAGGGEDRYRALRIAGPAIPLVAHDEVAEAGDLDLLAALERLLDDVEHGLDDLGGFLLGEAANLLVDRFDDVGLGHSRHGRDATTNVCRFANNCLESLPIPRSPMDNWA